MAWWQKRGSRWVGKTSRWKHLTQCLLGLSVGKFRSAGIPIPDPHEGMCSSAAARGERRMWHTPWENSPEWRNKTHTTQTITFPKSLWNMFRTQGQPNYFKCAPSCLLHQDLQNKRSWAGGCRWERTCPPGPGACAHKLSISTLAL